MASSTGTLNFPYFPPPPAHPKPPSPPAPQAASPPPPHAYPPPPLLRPPPPPHVYPPPPHVRPPPSPHVRPPSPLPPAPSPGHHTTIIVIVFVSFGGLFLLAFLAVALFCFIKKKKKTVKDTDTVHIDEHLKVVEAIVAGPHGPQTVMLEIEDDVRIDENIRKEKFSKGLHHEGNPSSREMGTPSPSWSSNHPRVEHRA